MIFVRKIQAVSKVAIALILSLSLFISSLPFSPPAAAATSEQNILSSLTQKQSLKVQLDSDIRIEGESFLPDISLLSRPKTLKTLGVNASSKINFAPIIASKIKPTLKPTLEIDTQLNLSLRIAPTLSLIDRVNFYLHVDELNFIKIVVNQDRVSQSYEFYKQGVDQLNNNEYSQAIESFTKALSLDGNFAEAYTSRGRAYSLWSDELISQRENRLGQRYKKRAMEQFEKALNVPPKQAEDPIRYVDPLLARSLVYLKEQNYEAALNDLNTALERNPDFYEAYLSRATLNSGFGNREQALNDLNIALDKKPDYPAAFFRRGSILSAQKEYEQALKDFERVLFSQQSDAEKYYADTYYKMGLIYLDSHQYSEAINAFSRSNKIDQNYSEAYYARGLAYGLLGDREREIYYYNKAINAAINRRLKYPDVYYRRGLIHFEQGELTRALVDFQCAIALDNENSSVRYYLANSYLKLGEYDQAIAEYNLYLESDLERKIENLDFYLQRGIAYYFNEEQLEAINDFKKVIELQDSNSEAYFWLGNCLYNSGKYTEAIDKYQEALSINLNLLEAYLWRGKTFYKLKQYAKGAFDFNTVNQFFYKYRNNENYAEEIQQFIQEEIFYRILTFSEPYAIYPRTITEAFNDNILATSYKNSKVKLWDIKTGKLVSILTGHSKLIRSIAFSGDGQLIATGSNDGLIKVWKWKTKENIKTLRGHTDNVTSVQFSPDGYFLASGGNDRLIRLWDWQHSLEVAKLSGHDSYIQSLEFSPDGHSLISIDHARTLQVHRIP